MGVVESKAFRRARFIAAANANRTRITNVNACEAFVKVLVTGGAGFIGSHLANRLIQASHHVIIVDNESTGRISNVPAAAQYIKGDVRRSRDLEHAFVDGLEAVLHIVGQVSLIRSYTDPSLDLQTNVEGTLNVLQLCLKYRVARLLYASSMTVYGHSATLPIREDTPCQPISYYGITKYAAERYVHATALRKDLDSSFDVTSFRMFSVYGPGQALDNPYQGVLGIFLGNVLRGEPITIFGDGEQSRDFVYIDDVVDAWVGALDEPATFGQVINLGSGRRVSINEVADQTLAAFGRSRKNHPIEYRPARSGEQGHVEADIARAQSLLGWSPRTSFTQGLGHTVRWAEQNHESSRTTALGGLIR
jgi:UDP-glucose 4-epimerase